MEIGNPTNNMSTYGQMDNASLNVNSLNYLNVNLSEESNAKLDNETSTSKDPLISFTVPAIMFAAGVVGNVLALVVLGKSSRETKRRPFYKLVGALACTDLLGTCATSPVTLAVYANNLKWIGGTPLCNYESFMLIFAGCATISIICAMALDRFFSICRPFVYDKYMSTGRAKYILLGLWIFAMVMGCLPIIGLGENIIQFPGTWCFFTFTSSKIKNQIYTYTYASIGFLGILVTGLSNLFVTSVLLKMQHRQKQTMSICYTCDRRMSKETQMLILLFGVIAIFSTCWGPFLVRIIINQVNKSQVNVKADLLALRLASLNQILDPWIYILFRKGVVKRASKCIRNVIGMCVNIDSKYTKAIDGNGNKNKYNFSSENIISYSSDGHVTYGENSVADEIKTFPRKLSRQASKKMLMRTKSAMLDAQLKLINGHTQDCPGLKHSSCLYCFTSLPQSFAILLGTSPDQFNASVQETKDTSKESSNSAQEPNDSSKESDNSVQEQKDSFKEPSNSVQEQKSISKETINSVQEQENISK